MNFRTKRAWSIFVCLSLVLLPIWSQTSNADLVTDATAQQDAAAGEVIYAANGLADYGNLVLVRHSNGFMTAYAHNKSLTVRRGQRVRQGQVVAKSGQSGSVSSPQVHFEIREGKTPVNPMSHLSG